MTSPSPQSTSITIRSFQRRDLEGIQRLYADQVESLIALGPLETGLPDQKWKQIHRWYGVLKCLSLFPNPLQHSLCAFVADQGDRLRGVIQFSPFNRTRSTWRIDHVITDAANASDAQQFSSAEIGTQLLRYCFQSILEARTWLTEVNVNDNSALALYRQNGFQPLARMTYWSIAADHLQQLAEREPDLPNLLPVSNADACLLHQLDTISMPPLIRQVFDRQPLDFKTTLLGAVVDSVKHRINHSEVISSYVFEAQRKVAIGYYRVHLCHDGSYPHSAELTVNPAYTWLYPELASQIARITRNLPPQALHLASADYQPEREAYLEQIGADRVRHTLMMSRSIWHKVRETRFVSLEGLQLSEVLQSLQPSRKPVPGRFSLMESIRQLPKMSGQNDLSFDSGQNSTSSAGENPNKSSEGE
jgi:hypothetical protein